MLKISKELFASIKDHGQKTFPNECCGVLLGTIGHEAKEVERLFPIENKFEAAERYHRFLITPDDYRAAERTSRSAKLEILGFYHSHPDAPSIASKYDLEHAFPWFSYLIVSVTKGRYADHHSWIMEDDRTKFNEENVIIV